MLVLKEILRADLFIVFHHQNDPIVVISFGVARLCASSLFVYLFRYTHLMVFVVFNALDISCQSISYIVHLITITFNRLSYITFLTV